MQIHVLYMPVMDQMSIPMPTRHRNRHLTVWSPMSKDSDPKHRNIRDMEGTSTYSTMRVECIVFYVDPKSVGSLNFLGKE